MLVLSIRIFIDKIMGEVGDHGRISPKYPSAQNLGFLTVWRKVTY